MSITEKQAAAYGTAAPPVPPLVITFTLRDGQATAEIRIPLDATSAEINRMCLHLEAMERELAGFERSHSADGLSVLQRELEREPEREPRVIERMDQVDALLAQRSR